jgi:hypothetical protein
MKKHERHLIPHSAEALKKWCMENVGPYCTKFVGGSVGMCTCRDIRIAANRISRWSLEIHGRDEQGTKQI